MSTLPASDLNVLEPTAPRLEMQARGIEFGGARKADDRRQGPIIVGGQAAKAESAGQADQLGIRECRRPAD